MPNDAGLVVQPDGAVTLPNATPKVYVAKVKNLLIGAAPTDDEIERVEADPSALRTLIDGWMMQPTYAAKLQTFFDLAFQQTQISIADLADQAYPRQLAINNSTRTPLTQNMRESFARTVAALIMEGKPFSEVATTTRFMMTPALMEAYAFLDTWQVNNAGKVTDRLAKKLPNATITVSAKQRVPLSDTVNPLSPDFMHWYDPDLPSLASRGAGCDRDPIVYPLRADTLHFLMHGSLLGYKSEQGTSCPQYGGSAQAPQLGESDFTQWKMVQIRAPKAAEDTTPFYDLPTLRAANELVLSGPRVGFFSTPAFFANWQTNTSNQMRVTLNQSLIVALGAAVDGTDATVPDTTPGLTAGHSDAPACVFCHRTLDPTRSILAATYSWTYHQQDEAAFSGQLGLFAFQGVIKPVADVFAFASTLATHPRFAPAWVQKLCTYASSAPCDEGDPEFVRIVAAFRDSGLQFPALVRELFASPLVTFAARGPASGQEVAIARRDHLCTALDTRLGFSDVCGLDSASKQADLKLIQAIVPGLPSDGYGRGAVAPVLPNDPTLFYRAGLENLCASVAELVIDVPAKKQIAGVRRWQSAQSDAALEDFVSLIMALAPGDSRHRPALDALKKHVANARAISDATSALKSAFIVACLSPSSLGIGI